MANAEQVKALVKSIANGDEEHFVSVALQISASEAKAGRSTLAEELRDLADEIKRNRNGSRSHRAVPITKPTGELAGLLTAVYPQTRFAEMVLDQQTLKKLERVRHEFRATDKLRGHGLQPDNRLNFLSRHHDAKRHAQTLEMLLTASDFVGFAGAKF